MRATRATLCALIGAMLFAFNSAAADLPTNAKASESAKAQPPSVHAVVQKLGTLPLRFELNQGQVDSRVKFVARAPGYTLFLTKDEAVLSLSKLVGHDMRRHHDGDSDNVEQSMPEFETSVVRMRLVGANAEPSIAPDSQQTGVSNYFIGQDRSKWHTAVPGYGRVTYRSVYPGIDLVFYGNPQRLEYDFTAAPGADPSQIQLAFQGADSIQQTANGDLLLQTGNETVTIHKPLVYQADKKKPIDARFVLRADNRVSFSLGAYDRSLPLTIDPQLTYSTYLGGSVTDLPLGIRLDSQGNIVIAGTTASSDFPGGPHGTVQGSSDIFVTSMDPLGRFLHYTTFVGGSGTDGTLSDFGTNTLALDANDNVYVAGLTQSRDFPTVGAIQPNHGGGDNDAFVFELSASGQTLLFSSYFGGTANDYASGLALDAAGNIIIGGDTDSTDLPLAAALQSQAGEAGIYVQTDGVNWSVLNNGLTATDVWVITVDPSNHATLYAGANGGGVYKSTDTGVHWAQMNNGLVGLSVRALAVDPITPANVYVGSLNGGFSRSTNGGATWTTTLVRATRHIVVNPANPGIILAAMNGGIFRSTDFGNTFTQTLGGLTAFWVALDPNNPNRAFAATSNGVHISTDGGVTWGLTGSGLTTAQVVTVDPSNPNTLYASVLCANATPCGFFKSTDGGITWPLHNLEGNNLMDIVVSPTTPNLLYAPKQGYNFVQSFDGGNTWQFELNNTGLRSMAVVAGSPHDTLYVGTHGQDGWVAKLAAGGAGVIYSTFIAGNRTDGVIAVATDPPGNAVVTGFTVSDQGFPLVNAFQNINNNGDSCFITRLNSSGSAYVYSTLLGGSTSFTQCFAAASDSAGNAYVTGSTGDTDFPLVNPAQAAFGGGCCDLFATKFSPNGSVLYSTFWGGGGDEDGRGLFADSGENLYLTGDTGSFNFPTVNPIQPGAGFGENGENAVVMKFSPTGAVLFATYLGGESDDNGDSIVVNSNGDIYVTGLTYSQSFPLTGDAFQKTDNTGGNGTGFISKIAFFPPMVQLSSNFFNFGPVPVNGQSAIQTLTVTNTGTGPLQFAGPLPAPGTPINKGSAFYNAGSNCPLVLGAGSSCYFQAYFQPPGVGVFNDVGTIHDNAANSPQIVNLTGTGVETFAAASVTPSVLHFGNIGVNFTSPSQAVTITSTGTAPLIFNSITTSDPEFAISGNTCPVGAPGLNPGFSCAVSVDVTPATATFITGNLIINDDAADSPQMVALDATGIQTVTVTQTLSPTQNNVFTFPNQTYTYAVQFPAGTQFSNVTASVTVGPTSTNDFQARVVSTFPGAQCIVYDGSNGTCTVFQIKCTPSPCPTSPQPNITVKTAFDSSQPITNPGFLQAESGTNNWRNIFTEFLLPKIDGTVKGGTDGFSDFVAVNLPVPPNVTPATFTGFMPPLAPKNGHMFSRGTTIAVKFQLVPASGPARPITNAVAKLALVSGATEMPVKLANNHGTAPNVFKYNSVLNDYEFYLDTTSLPAGVYQLTVFSNSFAAQQVTFTLQ